jgi:hypothetical protein
LPARAPTRSRSTWDGRAPTAQLSLAAAAIAVPLGVFVATSPIWAGQPSRPPAPTHPDLEPQGWAGALLMLAFVAATCLPFRPYLLAQRAARDASLAARLPILLTALLGAVAVLIYPAFGGDLFDYAGFERMWVAYGDNPLFALPVNHPQDWLTPYVWYPDRTPAYGPLWALLTWPIVRLAGDSPVLIVLGYKILSTAAYAGCCSKCLGRSTTTSCRRWRC